MKRSEAFKKNCPFYNNLCKPNECMFWVKTNATAGYCSVLSAAKKITGGE